MKLSVERAVYAELERHMKAMVDIIDRNPEYRGHVSYALLGSAVAHCDTFGVSVEDFIAELRRRTTKPEVLVPPKKGAS